MGLVPLMLVLNRNVNIDVLGQLKDLKITLLAYLEAGAHDLFRSLGKVLAYSVCAREAALFGPVAAAAYNLTFQLGFATTQICEAVAPAAAAVQTLLAREIADETSRSSHIRSKAIRYLINGSWRGSYHVLVYTYIFSKRFCDCRVDLLITTHSSRHSTENNNRASTLSNSTIII